MALSLIYSCSEAPALNLSQQLFKALYISSSAVIIWEPYLKGRGVEDGYRDEAQASGRGGGDSGKVLRNFLLSFIVPALQSGQKMLF
jgi:hypothetical protein